MINTGYKRVNRDLKVFTGNANPQLAMEICEHLQIPLGQINVTKFSDGELYCQILENVRGKDVFLVQPTCCPVNNNLMELLIMIDAFKRSSATRITSVIPYYGYARQDRKDKPRVPITSKLVADLLTAAGTHRILTVDLHVGQIQGFFDIPVDHLYAMVVMIDYLKKLNIPNLTVVSPDAGRVKVAERYANLLHADLAIVHKRRVKGEKKMVEAKEVVGEVVGRTCVLIDDMIDTGGTLVAAAEQLKERGAARVFAAATHGVLSGPAIERIANSVLEKVVITNTLPLPPEKQIDKIEVLSAAGIIADAIDAVFEESSVSEIFDGQNQH